MTITGTVLLASLPVLVWFFSEHLRTHDKTADLLTKKIHLATPQIYDFIIVGGGTAGCLLANRLSSQFSVLVIEAGGDPPPLVGVPALSPPISVQPEINFLYTSTPQKNAGRANAGIVPVPSGKMLGGSSSHNHLQWEQGHPGDYDRWAAATKDDSWSYKNILKYYNRIENYHRPTPFSLNYVYHKSPEQIDLIQSSLGVSKLWLEAGRELGHPVNDPERPQTFGFKPIVYATQRGTRASAYMLYLKPILKPRHNKLKVLRYSYVSKILFDEHDAAIGVQYERHGIVRVAYASKEVILSAGAFISPIILFKSGIGPEDQILAARAQRHIADLPVGQNLVDHTTVPVGPFLVPPGAGLSWTIERNLSFKDIFHYIIAGQGPLTTPYHGTEALILSDKGDKFGFPNLQIYYNPAHTTEPNAVTCVVSSGRPSSRGVLTINSSATGMDDDHLPLLDYNYFGFPSDYELAFAGINFCLDVIEKTETFKAAGVRLSPEPYGPCNDHPFRSKGYWKCFIRHTAASGFHTSGTCRMGHGPSDRKAVVDSKLRVIGVKRLRVIDASVFPYVTNANTYAPTLLVAEKAADDILFEYSHHPPG